MVARGTHALHAAETEIKVTPELAAEHGLTPEEYARIQKILGRDPNFTELGIFSVMWSEHCSYKSSRVHLRACPRERRKCCKGPGENAGVVDVGDGLAAVFKMESHNHPSYVEPFQGAATGVGGILRDIFTMGARPIAVLDSLRFGAITRRESAQAPETIARNRRLVDGVVRGIAFYGNCFGVPTVGGEVEFEPGYAGNPLVNVLALGIAPKRSAVFRPRARRRQSGDLRRREDRARRHSRRLSAGLRGIHRGVAAEAAQRASGRSVSGEAAARSLPRSDGHRRDRRHSRHGRGRAHQLLLRNGFARRRGHRN